MGACPYTEMVRTETSASGAPYRRRAGTARPGGRALQVEKPPRAGGASPSPTGFEKTFRFCVGEPLGAPARICTGTVGSEKPGAEVEPHQLQFLSSQVPVAREESRKPLRFWAPGMMYNFSGGHSP